MWWYSKKKLDASVYDRRNALGPRYIEFHPTLPIAYVVNELSSEVAVFLFNKEKARRIIDLLENRGIVYK